MPNVDFHSSADKENLATEFEASLQANRLDPKFLYVTPRQAELWRRVALRHAPRSPEFYRIYNDAFALAARELRGVPKIWLIGLGCGTGGKEARLCHACRSQNGTEIFFSAVDVSNDLVREASDRVTDSGASPRRHLVCDLTRIEAVRDWLDRQDLSLPRLFTFFGLMPNFLPSQAGAILRTALRPGDLLLASVHLAPVGGEEKIDLPSAMRIVRPQYDNAETLAWLNTGLDQWGLSDRVNAPEIEIGEIENISAFLGHAKWKIGAPQSLRLFYSLRYTPELFETFLRCEGLLGERLAITACRQEAIWRIRQA